MILPDFYARVPTIRVRDPLADLLGAARRGVLEYTYADAVKLAGHSCPTVASAYALTRRALAALYGSELPVRGDIAVHVAGSLGEGVNGVVASIVTLITGAAGDGGFKGLAGRYIRRQLLHFGADQPFDLRFTRLDTGARVDAHADTTRVPMPPALAALFERCLLEQADAAERAAFAQGWQDRVQRLLIDHADDQDVFFIHTAAAEPDRSGLASTASPYRPAPSPAALH